MKNSKNRKWENLAPLSPSLPRGKGEEQQWQWERGFGEMTAPTLHAVNCRSAWAVYWKHHVVSGPKVTTCSYSAHYGGLIALCMIIFSLILLIFTVWLCESLLYFSFCGQAAAPVLILTAVEPHRRLPPLLLHYIKADKNRGQQLLHLTKPDSWSKLQADYWILASHISCFAFFGGHLHRPVILWVRSRSRMTG